MSRKVSFDDVTEMLGIDDGNAWIFMYLKCRLDWLYMIIAVLLSSAKTLQTLLLQSNSEKGLKHHLFPSWQLVPRWLESSTGRALHRQDSNLRSGLYFSGHSRCCWSSVQTLRWSNIFNSNQYYKYMKFLVLPSHPRSTVLQSTHITASYVVAQLKGHCTGNAEFTVLIPLRVFRPSSPLLRRRGRHWDDHIHS